MQDDIITTTLDAIAAVAGQPMPDAAYRAYIGRTVIPETLRRWGFEQRFYAEQPFIQAQEEVYQHAGRLLRGTGAIVALIGKRGTGKTSIAAKIARDQAWRNYESSIGEPGTPVVARHVVYCKATKLVARYKPLFADFGSVETETLLKSLDFLCREQELLVIDELHDCYDLKAQRRVLTDLIDRRYSMLRDTILISNQTADDFCATAGESILSRLSEHGAILECTWESFR